MSSHPFSSPRQQGGQYRNSVSGCGGPSGAAVSTPSDRAVMPMRIVGNAPPEAVKNSNSTASPSFSPWQNGRFAADLHTCTVQPTQVRTPQNAPEAVKASFGPDGYNGNKLSGAGGSGPLDRKEMAMIMMDGYELPEIQCPCGSGPCIVLTSRTAKNPNRQFYKCPAKVCNFFKWCDELGRSSRSPLKPSQGFTRSHGKIIKPQSSPLKPDQPICSCRAGPCIVQIMHEGENKGRKYYACSIKKGYGACNHFEWVDSPVKPPETENYLNENQNDSLINDMATPEPKQVLSPYESVKDLFGENDMTTIEFWCKDQNDPNYTAVTTNNETTKQLSPGKRPHQPSSLGEISPMKRLNIYDASPAVKNCPTCGAIGQCIECPILTCFKDDDFAVGKHENVSDEGNNSNFANISPNEWPSVQKISPSPNLTLSGAKRSGTLF